MNTSATPKQNPCHGCGAKGWVTTNGINAVKCPVCNGSGVYVQSPFNPYYPNWPYPQITCGNSGFMKTDSKDYIVWNQGDTEQ